MPGFALPLLLVAGIVADPQPSDPAQARVKELKAAIKTFHLELNYNGDEEKPFYRLTLTVAPIGYDRSNPFYRLAQVSEEHATKIIDHLAADGFLTKAVDRPKRPRPTTPGYTLTVGNFYEDLAWGLSMLKRLDGVRKVLDGDAAKGMDFLLARLSGLRAQWEKDAATGQAPANTLPWSKTVGGLQVALQVDPTIWPLHTQDGKPFPIVLKLHIKNVSDKPVSLHDWRDQPGAILLAFASGQLVEWGGGNNGVAPTRPPVDLAPGKTHIFEHTAQLQNGKLIWPILSGGIYHWPNMGDQSLPPGSYELRGIYEMGSPSQLIEAVSVVKVKVVVAPTPASQPDSAK